MVSIIILAAGNGSRMELGYNKMLYKLDGLEIYKRTLAKFKKFKKIILVVNESDIDKIEVDSHIKIVVGGKTRGESVYNALKHVDSKYVLIHDGARCFVSEELVDKCISQLEFCDCLGVGVKVKNTIKYLDNGIVTLDRDKLIEMQTPQGGKTELFLKCYEEAFKDNYLQTDDLAIIEKYSDAKINFVLGDYSNIKITTKDDLSSTRIGHSFDVHRLVSDRRLILGGVHIPYEKGLLGHSDADCVLHAVSESILGALALGDLGKLFPDNDMKNKDLDSKIITRHVVSLMKTKGYIVGNIDVMIYAEKPKMAPFIDIIRESIAELLETGVNNVSVKATTYERLGEIGEEKAIASEAVCMLKKW